MGRDVKMMQSEDLAQGSADGLESCIEPENSMASCLVWT
jgi:hypothetical protein